MGWGSVDILEAEWHGVSVGDVDLLSSTHNESLVDTISATCPDKKHIHLPCTVGLNAAL